jgi:hypothetical protein
VFGPKELTIRRIGATRTVLGSTSLILTMPAAPHSALTHHHSSYTASPLDLKGVTAKADLAVAMAVDLISWFATRTCSFYFASKHTSLFCLYQQIKAYLKIIILSNEENYLRRVILVSVTLSSFSIHTLSPCRRIASTITSIPPLAAMVALF